MSMYPLVLFRFVQNEGLEIMIQSLVLGKNCVENRVTHIFEARKEVLEFILVFEAG